MAKVTEIVEKLAAPVVEQAGCQLWDVEYVREAGQWYLRLYLDTHPEDADGLALLKDLLQKRRMLTEDFAQACYPLTPDCMGTVYLQNPDSSCFCWQEGPAPWEGDCCCMAGQDNDRRQTDPALRKGGCA